MVVPNVQQLTKSSAYVANARAENSASVQQISSTMNNMAAQDQIVSAQAASNQYGTMPTKKQKSGKSSSKQHGPSSGGNKAHGGGGSHIQNHTSICPYHLKQYVAFCIIHNELVCEECCDLSHHRDHNNQILLLKAAAQNFIQGIDRKLDQMV